MPQTIFSKKELVEGPAPRRRQEVVQLPHSCWPAPPRQSARRVAAALRRRQRQLQQGLPALGAPDGHGVHGPRLLHVAVVLRVEAPRRVRRCSESARVLHCLDAAVRQVLVVLEPVGVVLGDPTSSLSITPRFQAGNPVCLAPARTRTWTRTWTRNLDKFYHVFSSYRATCPSSPGEWKELGQLRAAGYKLSQYCARFQPGPDSNFVAQGGNPNLDKNLDKELGQVLSRVFLFAEPLVQVRPKNLDKELGQLRAAVLQALSVLRPDSRQASIPCASPLSLEGVSQMGSIPPERLPALVRPEFDLVLRRICCVQACWLQNNDPQIWTPFFGTPFFFFFLVFS